MLELVREVQAFVRAGGAPTWSEWRSMDAQTRAAFVEVNRRHLVEQALRVGLASQGPLEVLRVGAEIDGGEALEHTLLEKAVRDAVQ